MASRPRAVAHGQSGRDPDRRRRGPVELALGEWAVLGAVSEGTTHGFDVARRFAPEGVFGRVWAIPRPLVYRAIHELLRTELVGEAGSTTSVGGPPRRLVAATAAGRRALQAWLDRPVAHVRDARSELLMKLLIAERAGRDPHRLLRSQASALAPIISGLHVQLTETSGFDETLVRWRLHSAETLLAFVTELDARRGPR